MCDAYSCPDTRSAVSNATSAPTIRTRRLFILGAFYPSEPFEKMSGEEKCSVTRSGLFNAETQGAKPEGFNR